MKSKYLALLFVGSFLAGGVSSFIYNTFKSPRYKVGDCVYFTKHVNDIKFGIKIIHVDMPTSKYHFKFLEDNLLGANTFSSTEKVFEKEIAQNERNCSSWIAGSGKSTIAKKHFPNYVYINQDELGTKDACLTAYIEALSKNKDVIIDRTNINRRQRKDWINIGQYHGAQKITCIVLDVSENECISRIHLRKNHKTIPEDISLDKKRKIVYTFSRDYEPPSLDEGFDSILITRN